MEMPEPNKNKNLIIEINGQQYARYPIKTHLITPLDKNIPDLIQKYTQNLTQKGDIVFISEKIIAIMQGRSYPISEIKPSKMASWLSRFVHKNSAGIGLASPETMQLAIEDVGLARILISALVAAITKLFGIRGMFYRLAGDKARAIDGAVEYAIPPYNTYVKKCPLCPDKVAREISAKFNLEVAVVDANDLGVRILGKSRGVDKNLIIKALKDNPLGQTDESTPIGILRKI